MDWVAISGLATGAGTLVLAIATFGSVRSANRTARVAERSLLAGLAPVLLPSREEDPPERVMFGDRHWVTLKGHGAILEAADGNVYMAVALRNAGSGPAVLHGWYATADRDPVNVEPPPLDDFRRQIRDIYVPAGDLGFWQGRVRASEDANYAALEAATRTDTLVTLFLLYGDHEGGQRTIARFGIVPAEDGGGRQASVSRYWNLDRDDPR